MSDWQFKPGMRNGVPVKVPVTLDLAWGPRDLPAQAMDNLKLAMNAPSAAAAANSTTRPALLYNPLPPYTEDARNAGLEGTVVIALTVGTDGSPRDLHVVKPLGKGLDETAIQTVSTWRFQPLRLNGKSAEMPTTVEVNFRLQNH